MPSNQLTLIGKKIELGSSGQLNLRIARLHNGSTVKVPLHYISSEKPGPVVIFMAGIHGDELNGVEIVRRLEFNDQCRPLCGAIIFMPVLNVFGFLNKERAFPDGRDLNRSFPGSKKGSLASRFAYHFMDQIAKDIDIFIDFHTGGAQRSNYPQIRIDASRPENCTLASYFNAPFTIEAPERSQTFRASAQRLDKTVLLFEGGKSNHFDEKVIEKGIEGAFNVLSALNMTPKSPVLENTQESIPIDDSKWLRARSAGLFRSLVANGTFVEKGQVIGEINDTFGEYNYRLKADEPGYIICINEDPIVNQGDALFHLAFEKMNPVGRRARLRNFWDE